jgi:hypothetical protein
MILAGHAFDGVGAIVAIALVACAAIVIDLQTVKLEVVEYEIRRRGSRQD